MIKQFSVFFGSCLFFYLLGAFIMASFNLAEWTEAARVFIGVLGSFLSAAISFIVVGVDL